MKYLTDVELNALNASLWSRISVVEATSTDDRLRLRNGLLLLLAVHTGARASEILNLKVSSFNATTGSISVKGLKGSNDREIPLPHPIVELLQRHIARLTTVSGHYPVNTVVPKSYSSNIDDIRLFDISYKRLFQIWSQHKLTKHNFHSLRHSMGVSLYKRTRDIHLVKYVLGHKSISNTMIYLDYVHSQESLKKAFNIADNGYVGGNDNEV